LFVPGWNAARLRSVVEQNVRGFSRRAMDESVLTDAAVALCIVTVSDTPSLLFTRRSANLRSYAGQFALPGGRCEPGETAPDTARRELAEETGLDLPPDAALGSLDDYPAPPDFRITPVVLWGGSLLTTLHGPPEEVESVFPVSLSDLDVEPHVRPGQTPAEPRIALPLMGRHIHAPAAAIVYQFCQAALHGQTVRVDRFTAGTRA
jgi:8-oxo-dGTP pyrophosphatase MutT (NUDIX family)